MNIHPMVAEFIPRLLDDLLRREVRKPAPPALARASLLPR
jgi:hypothetical protein